MFFLGGFRVKAKGVGVLWFKLFSSSEFKIFRFGGMGAEGPGAGCCGLGLQ